MNETNVNLDEPRVLRIGIASHDSVKQRLLAATRGERPLQPDEPKLWFSSLDALFRVLSAENRQMMAIISREHPPSVSALAKRLGRDQGNVSRALSSLEQLGLIRLTRDGREKRPEAVITQLHLDLDFATEQVKVA
jgi:predicted transcriptional regulator